MTNSELYNILVKYIEDNKVKYNIPYSETIENLRDLFFEIEDDYMGLE